MLLSMKYEGVDGVLSQLAKVFFCILGTLRCIPFELSAIAILMPVSQIRLIRVADAVTHTLSHLIFRLKSTVSCELGSSSSRSRCC